MARKAIDKDILRELYLKSGNICAFPNCLHPIMNSEGVYVAQICHIEAASPKGQRFNKSLTDDQIASYENLLLMCYRHHKETDDVTKFPVEKLREIKKSHEAKFSSVIDALANDVIDTSQIANLKIPSTLSSLVNAKEIDDSEVEVFLKELNLLGDSLRQLSPTTRKIFLFALNRQNNCKLGFFEFLESVSLPKLDAYNHIRSLENSNLIRDNQDSDIASRTIEIVPVTRESPFPISILAYQYCKSKNIDAGTLFLHLDFSSLK